MNINFLSNKNTFNIFQQKTPLNFVSFKGMACDVFIKRNEKTQLTTHKSSKTPKTKPDSSKKEKVYVSREEFQSIYNFSDEEMEKLPKRNLVKRTPIGSISSINIQNADMEFINIENPRIKEIIDEHNKITPITAGKYFKKEGETIPPVPLNIIVKLGFGSEDEIKDAIKSGKIKGLIKKEEKSDKEEYFVDINGFKAEYTLKNIRKENENIIELWDFAMSTGLTQENILKALKNGELVIIKQFIFESDRDKAFIDLNNPKNAEYLNKIGYKNTPLI